MTLDEFFTELSQLKDQGWHLDRRKQIRNQDGFCPVCAVAKLHNYTGADQTKQKVGYHAAARVMELSMNDATDIALASDEELRSNHHFIIRQGLKKILCIQ